MKAKQTAFFAKNADMSPQNGWGSVRDVASGILLLKSLRQEVLPQQNQAARKAGTRSIKAASS